MQLGPNDDHAMRRCHWIARDRSPPRRTGVRPACSQRSAGFARPRRGSKCHGQLQAAGTGAAQLCRRRIRRFPQGRCRTPILPPERTAELVRFDTALHRAGQGASSNSTYHEVANRSERTRHAATTASLSLSALRRTSTEPTVRGGKWKSPTPLDALHRRRWCRRGRRDTADERTRGPAHSVTTGGRNALERWLPGRHSRTHCSSSRPRTSPGTGPLVVRRPVRGVEPGTSPYIGPGRPFGGFHDERLGLCGKSRHICNVAMADGSCRSFIRHNVARSAGGPRDRWRARNSSRRTGNRFFSDVKPPLSSLYQSRDTTGRPMTDTPILRALSAAVGASDAAPDGELLRRFAEGADRTAFELVVRRHAEMVWGVCRTALARDRHAAEDAFQATFLVLARKSATIRDASAAGWLFRVARNVAVRARATLFNERPVPYPTRSRVGAVRQTMTPRETRSRRSSPRKSTGLRRKFREPVVLCFFEGHTHAEAAARLGWPIGTVASRLARAKDLLRDSAHAARRRPPGRGTGRRLLRRARHGRAARSTRPSRPRSARPTACRRPFIHSHKEYCPPCDSRNSNSAPRSLGSP